MNKEEHILSINFPLPGKLRNDSLKERKDMGEKRKLCALSHASPLEGEEGGSSRGPAGWCSWKKTFPFLVVQLACCKLVLASPVISLIACLMY